MVCRDSGFVQVTIPDFIVSGTRSCKAHTLMKSANGVFLPVAAGVERADDPARRRVGRLSYLIQWSTVCTFYPQMSTRAAIGFALAVLGIFLLEIFAVLAWA